MTLTTDQLATIIGILKRHGNAPDRLQLAEELLASREREERLRLALEHAVRIAEATQAGTWDDLLAYRKLLEPDFVPRKR